MKAENVRNDAEPVEVPKGWWSQPVPDSWLPLLALPGVALFVYALVELYRVSF